MENVQITSVCLHKHPLKGGSEQMQDKSAPLGAPQKRVSFKISPANDPHAPVAVNINETVPSKIISDVPGEIKTSPRNEDVAISNSNIRTGMRAESSEILEKARAAIASAERASAAARAAAELAKIQHSPRKLEGKS